MMALGLRTRARLVEELSAAPAGVPAAGDAFATSRGTRWPSWPVLLSGAIISIVCVCALVPGLLSSFDPNQIDLPRALAAPSGAHWLGTDEYGRDILTRIVYGARVSLPVGVLVAVASAALGGALGLLAGYLGGWIDEALMRLTDVFLSVPFILLPMVVVVTLGPGLIDTSVALFVVWWPPYCRLLRGQVVAERRRTYVSAALVLGVSRTRILFRHILPNLIGPVVVMVTMDVGLVILSVAGLGFLGLGAQPPTAEWGLMTSQGLEYVFTSWWVSFFPGLAIALTVFAFNLLGDQLTTRLGRS
jgi:peptide/nickel transport system permease protein